ncbi:MAG: hypothetical protein LC798_21970 [Chloroflexi bacterium]|nr:hypothetical protein [Chloroflexota bacterium]
MTEAPRAPTSLELETTRSFRAEHAALAFPLGGIGTGNVSLGARGDLRDWELFNRPGKGTRFPNTFFAIRARAGDRRAVTRVLEGPIPGPHDLSHGYHPSTAAGLPRLADSTFRGEYPFGVIDFTDATLPVRVRLEAFTPFIPLDPEDSGLPCAVLTYSVTNTVSDSVALTLVGSLVNPVGGLAYDGFGNLAAGGLGRNRNDFRSEESVRGLFLYSEQYPAGSLACGDMSLATTHHDVTVKRAWLRGTWYDDLQEFWDDLAADGQLQDLGYDDPSQMGKTDTGSLGLLDTLGPGECRAYRFLLTWSFPNRTNSWDNDPAAAPIRNRYTRRPSPTCSRRSSARCGASSSRSRPMSAAIWPFARTRPSAADSSGHGPTRSPRLPLTGRWEASCAPTASGC